MLWQRFRSAFTKRLATHVGAWVLWVLLLAVPISYFRIPSLMGVFFGFLIALLPIIVAAVVSLWSALVNPKNDAKVIRRHTDTFSGIFTLLGVTSVYLGAAPTPGVPELAVLWGVAGFAIGLVWGSLYKRKSPHWRYVRFALLLFFVIAVFRSGKDFGSHGAPGALTGVAMISGLGFGFVLGEWLHLLLRRFRQTWQGFQRYGRHFSTFIVGYIAIVYVFAGLYAALWQYENHLSFGPSFLESYSGFVDFLFASLVTVSTLGSNDVTARTTLARALVSIEVLTGLFWITVVIAIVLKGVPPAHPPSRDEGVPEDADSPPDA